MTSKVLLVSGKRAAIAQLGQSRYQSHRREFRVDAADHLVRVVATDRPDVIAWDTCSAESQPFEFLKKLASIRGLSKKPLIIIAELRSELTSDKNKFPYQREFVEVELPDALTQALNQLEFFVLDHSPSILEGNGVCLDPATREVTRYGRKVNLGPTEIRLLKELMSRPGYVHSRDELVISVWDSRPDIDDRTIDVYVGRLRRALVRGNETSPIRTVRGAGYVFE